jgi:hypothetical protein
MGATEGWGLREDGIHEGSVLDGRQGCVPPNKQAKHDAGPSLVVQPSGDGSLACGHGCGGSG